MDQIVRTTQLNKTIFLKASPQVVWSYLVEKDKLKSWFHEADADLAVGQAYRLHDDGEDRCWGQVVQMEPFRFLSYTFTVKPMGDKQSMVSFELEEVPGGTRLHLTHDGVDLDRPDDLGLVTALDKGWDSHFGRLRERVLDKA